MVCDPHHIPRVGPTRGAAQADPSPAAAPAVIEGRARFARPQTDEAYFVCPRGLHRVYHGALMDLLRDEDYTPYRHAIHSALEYDPAIQERDVSGMNNPDEETAAEKFGAGEQCVGIARLLSTLPTPPPQGERDPGTEDHPT